MNEIIDPDLKCIKCNQVFQSLPITLAPCGWVVCSHHIDSDQMTCLICNNHTLEKKNCITTKNIELKYMRYELENSIKNLSKDVENFKQIKNNPNGFINEHFVDIKNKIEIQRAKVKKLVDEHFDQMYNYVSKMQSECKNKALDNLNLDKFNIYDLEKKVKELENDIKNEHSSIKKHDVLQKSSLCVSNFRIELQNLLDSLVDNKKYELTPISYYIEYDKLFGKLNTIPLNDQMNKEESKSRPSTPQVGLSIFKILEGLIM